MKIVKFLGGLGNQMFQYAFYRSLAQIYEDVKADLVGFGDYSLHNGFELKQVFNLEIRESSVEENLALSDERTDLLNRLRRKCFGAKHTYYVERVLSNYDPSIYADFHDKYYWGYWQNEKYFLNISDEIRCDFRFSTKELSSTNELLAGRICDSNSVSIHIRRGDYIGNPILQLLDVSYYLSAVKWFEDNLECPEFFIFSNDLDWCKRNLKIRNPVFVDANSGSDSYWDMYLMSHCRHNIIANSSFSWWAAWLNNNPKRVVVAPRRWYKSDVNFNINNLIPATWKLL